MKRRLFISSIILFSLVQPLVAQVDVLNLECEMLVNPLGIDVKEPRLSWQIVSNQRGVQQTAYHIIVSTSKEKLAKDEGDLWNTDKISSPQSIHVPYAGKVLNSGTACFWKVKVFTNKGETTWSSPAYWTMGLLNNGDWKARWIGYDKASPWDSITTWSRLSARYFRKTFQSLPPVKRATVYIVGLGLYELYINGKRVGDHLLSPAPTDYRKSVLYNTYDVTQDIRTGDNVIATVLGNGRFFTMRQNYKPQKINNFGFPKLLLQLNVEYTDGTTKTIVSDETWKLNADGPIRTNNEYDGEEYDATKEMKGWTETGFNDTQWLSPELVASPGGKIVAQMNEPIRAIRTITPVSIKVISDGKYIMDMGQNFSGWIKMQVRGRRGDKVMLRFAESLKPGGELYTANLRDARVTDIYTLKGEGNEQWQPSFVTHGFRYVEITGYPGIPELKDFEGQLISDDLVSTGSFQCSDSTINKIYRNAWWGIASDYKGMPVDCPQRNERQPWLGDRATGSGGEAFLFSNANLYAKWLDDIEQSQTAAGAIPDVAPAFWNYYSDNMTWPGTYLLVADMLYRQYGDQRSIIAHYPSMKKWMEYMKTKYMKDFIVTKDKYGDWCVPPESLELIRSKDSLRNTRGELIATAYYYHFLQLMKEFASVSGKLPDINEYDALMRKIGPAFHKRFYNPKRRCYDNNTVTANLLPLYFGMVPDSLRETILNDICNKISREDRFHISTGVIGTQWLMRCLTENGRGDLAYALASNDTYPSWGYMAKQGATTIWELWNGNTANPQMNSQNHVMLLGDLLIWLYEHIAGIRADSKDAAFRTIIMKPSFEKDLNEVNASYKSVYGTISSHWVKRGNEIAWDIDVPANATAIIYMPVNSSDDVKEGTIVATRSAGVQFIKMEKGNAVFQIASGHYSFTCNSSLVK